MVSGGAGLYDGDAFFEGYRALRHKDGNANDLVERPALFSLLPDVAGLRVLDLGCGWGDNCLEYARRGARSVLGIDVSARMLEVAARENAAPSVRYECLPIERLDRLEGAYDLVTSSLAMHYVADFASAAREVARLLSPGGAFVFSQEHPLTTCFSSGNRWTRDEAGEIVCANVYHYAVDGPRTSNWIVDGVVKRHRTFSSILNALIGAGLCVDAVLEPLPSEDVVARFPQYARDVHKPDFLLVRAVKPENAR